MATVRVEKLARERIGEKQFFAAKLEKSFAAKLEAKRTYN